MSDSIVGARLVENVAVGNNVFVNNSFQAVTDVQSGSGPSGDTTTIYVASQPMGLTYLNGTSVLAAE